VTLGGQVASENDKSQAESLAKVSGGRPGCRRSNCRDSRRPRKRSKGRELRSGPRHRKESG
jgi:hypothetical protein